MTSSTGPIFFFFFFDFWLFFFLGFAFSIFAPQSLPHTGELLGTRGRESFVSGDTVLDVVVVVVVVVVVAVSHDADDFDLFDGLPPKRESNNTHAPNASKISTTTKKNKEKKKTRKEEEAEVKPWA